MDIKAQLPSIVGQSSHLTIGGRVHTNIKAQFPSIVGQGYHQY